jgi:hypothetical protein
MSDLVTPSKTVKAVGGIMDWTTTLALVFGAFGGAIVAVMGGVKDLILAWLKRLAKGAKNYMASQIGKMASYMEAIDAIKGINNVDRVLVFRGKNGGGLPKPGKPYAIKAVHGWAKDKNRDPMHRYNFDMPIDAYYARLLEELIKEGHVEVEPENIPDGATLKVYYKSEGIVQSRLYFLGIMGDELLYISVATFSQKYNPADCIEIDLAVQRVISSLAI